MVAYSFKERFVDPILWGRKDQTIRAPRGGVGHAYEGQKLQLYTAMRTRSCRLILRTVCLASVRVELLWRPIVEFHVDDERLSPAQMTAFAQRDGFADVDDMERFWTETHPSMRFFDGTLIRWKPPAAPVEMGSAVA